MLVVLWRETAEFKFHYTNDLMVDYENEIENINS